MRIVIDMTEHEYEVALRDGWIHSYYSEKIKNGTPLPEGHGRLIDAEALKKEAVMCPTVGNSETLSLDIGDVERAPTIIEADKEVDEC